MKFINGYTKVLWIDVDGDFMPVACLTSNPIEETVEMMGTTTRDNLGWRTSTPTTQSYSISFSGIQIDTETVLGDLSKLSYNSLKIIKRNSTVFNWKIASNNGLFIDVGTGIITTLNESNDVDGYLEFDGSITGIGKPIAATELNDYVFQDANNFVFQDGNNIIF